MPVPVWVLFTLRTQRGAELDHGRRRCSSHAYLCPSGCWTHHRHFVPSRRRRCERLATYVISRCAVLPPMPHASSGVFHFVPHAKLAGAACIARCSHIVLHATRFPMNQLSHACLAICACVTRTSVRRAATSFHAMLPRTHFGDSTRTFAFPTSMRRGAVGPRRVSASASVSCVKPPPHVHTANIVLLGTCYACSQMRMLIVQHCATLCDPACTFFVHRLLGRVHPVSASLSR